MPLVASRLPREVSLGEAAGVARAARRRRRASDSQLRFRTANLVPTASASDSQPPNRGVASASDRQPQPPSSSLSLTTAASASDWPVPVLRPRPFHPGAVALDPLRQSREQKKIIVDALEQTGCGTDFLDVQAWGPWGRG